MYSKYLIAGFLFLLNIQVKAQKVGFELNARVNYSQPSEYTNREVRESFSRFPLNDSTDILTLWELSIDHTSDYKTNPGFEVNGLFNIRMSDRFSLRTGMGLNYGSFSVGSSLNFTLGDMISVDTIPRDTNDIFPIGSLCDCYENNSEDVIDGLDERTHQSMLNLAIPVELGYDIIPGKLSIRAGAYFQTPLYAAAKREYIDVEVSTTEDMTKCKFVIAEEKNTAATGINNFQWGVSSWINYQLSPKLQVEVGVRKLMNDTYVKEELQIITYDNNSFKPLTFSAGISYRFDLGLSSAGL